MRKLTPMYALVICFTICCMLPLLAEAPNGGWDADWSPDGSAIAFTSGSPHGVPNLWVAKADGTGMRRLTIRGAHEPKWMADGKTIVFGSIRSGQAAYYSIAVNGKLDSETLLTIIPAGAENPVWSPDGALVAYAVKGKKGASRDLWFARTGGGGGSGLATNFWIREWAWTPDGSTLAFVVGKAAGTSLWTIDLATKNMRLLYKGFCAAPSYSPDGKRLAISVPDVRSGFKIKVINIAKGTDRLVGVQTFNGNKIIWSPDGTRFYVCSSRKSEPAIWTVGLDGKNIKRLTPVGTPVLSPALSHDGTKFACQALPAGSYSPELYVCKSTGGEMTRLTHSSSSYWAPVWSADGGSLAFQSDAKHVSQLYVAASTGRVGNALLQVYNSDFAEVCWAPGGKKLIVADGGRLMTADAAGGKTPAAQIESIKNPTQTPRLLGGQLYFVEWYGEDAGISAVKLDGTGERKLTNDPAKKAKPQPEATPEPKPENEIQPQKASDSKAQPRDISKAGVLVASSEFFVAQNTEPAKPADKPSDSGEVGNPHSGMGLMGPLEDLKKDAVPPAVDTYPAVSPDGKSVAFIRNGQLWLIGSDGSAEKQLTQFAPAKEGTLRSLSNAVWSPDGSFVLFSSFTNESGAMSFGLRTCEVQSGSEKRIYSEAGDTEYAVYYDSCTFPPAFSADGKRIIFASIATGQPRIVSIALDGSDLQEMAAAPSSFGAVDAAGKKLAYLDLSNSLERIKVVDIASGKSVTLKL